MQRSRHRTVHDPTTLGSRSGATGSRTTPITSRNRKKRRPMELVKAVATLDTATDPRTRSELVEFIESIYEAEDLGGPVALFSTCYLGPPYIDHQMSLAGDILVHYKPNDALPAEFERARALVRSGAYAYIEVYDNGTLIPVRDTGDAVL